MGTSSGYEPQAPATGSPNRTPASVASELWRNLFTYSNRRGDAAVSLTIVPMERCAKLF